jgi:DNA-directed RNA polymerase specialized sigma24 family protein
MLSVASLFQGTAPGGARRVRRSLAAREEERRRLSAAMQELPEASRLALALRYFESARPRQIAVVLGISEERIEAILADAVREVAEILRRSEVVTPVASSPRPRERRTPARKAALS